MEIDLRPQLIVALLALGMALAFVIADRRSPTSRALSLFLAFVGMSIGFGALVALPYHARHGLQWWSGVFALPEALAFIYAYEWILRVRRTVPTRNLKTRFADRQLRVAQGLALVYLLLSLALPELRSRYFQNVEIGARPLASAEFWIFAAPLAVSLVLGIGSALLLLNRRPDKAELIRIVAFMIGAPLMASGLVVPVHYAPVTTAIGLLIFLVGGVQYHVIQGCVYCRCWRYNKTK